MSAKGNSGIWGGVEAGGTKFVCAIGRIDVNEQIHLLDRVEFPTTDRPEDVLARVTSWMHELEVKHGRLEAIGIGSFGPIDLRRTSARYGFITTTPKPGWQDTNIVGFFGDKFPQIPIGFDTDVNAAALGEHKMGAAQKLEDFVYVTIGTGIGAGGMSGGNLLHGLVHPEMGHLLLPTIPGDTFGGSCSYHGRCWEGLCSGPAIFQRTGVPASELPADHPAWQTVAEYMAFALANITFALSPLRIIIGGSVRKGGQLGEAAFFKAIRDKTMDALSAYLDDRLFNDATILSYIVPPHLGDDAGVIGSIELGRRAVA